MLCSINIRDLAVVESLELDLHSGLTVLTGETGAGKSILLTAMGLALGDRADPELIRPNADKAEINLQFDLTQAANALTWLDEQELADGANLIVRRIVSRDGRSRAFINGSAVTLPMLKQLGEKLIDIHGQHAHLSLMQRDEPCRIVDVAARNQSLLEQTDAAYRQWQRLHEQIEEAKNRAANAEQRRDLVEFLLKELEQSEIEDLDYQKLVHDHQLEANLEKVISTGRLQLDRLQENEYQSVDSQLAESIRALSEFSDIAAEFQSIVELLDGALIQVQESVRLLGKYLDTLESEPGRLEALEQRISVLHGLARKHQTSADKLPIVLANLREELNQIVHGAQNIAELEAQLDQVYRRYLELAESLSQRRKEAAAGIQAGITRIMRELGMPEGEFQIRIATVGDPSLPKPKGFDLVEFLVTTNPGMPPRGLAKVASGGELSRISLAIQVAAIDSSATETMVFDEVDAGIGGGVAEIVGQKLRALGNSRQVLCITHLAQVAAQSHQHLLVEKIKHNKETRSTVRPLSAEQRKAEIARMLGGVKITEQTLAHAQEMLDWHSQSTSNI